VEFNLQLVSGRNATLTTGGAEAGAYVGTACGPPELVGVGDAFGDPLADGDGLALAVADPCGRVARNMPVPASRTISTAAMIAGSSHLGRRLGSRSTGSVEGLRAEARGDTVDAATSGTGSATGAGSAGAGSPVGVQTGLAIGVQVCCG
jgi:hypothetical protein